MQSRAVNVDSSKYPETIVPKATSELDYDVCCCWIVSNLNVFVKSEKL